MKRVGGEREVCGPSKFSNLRTTRDRLQVEPLAVAHETSGNYDKSTFERII